LLEREQPGRVLDDGDFEFFGLLAVLLDGAVDLTAS
jgi:hypothetical protein